MLFWHVNADAMDTKQFVRKWNLSVSPLCFSFMFVRLYVINFNLGKNIISFDHFSHCRDIFNTQRDIAYFNAPCYIVYFRFKKQANYTWENQIKRLKMYPTVSPCPLLCGQFTWSNLLVSRKYLLYVSGGVQRGASARENRGLETAGSGSRNGKRNLWKAEHSKVFRLPFNAHPERKFPIRFFITSKVIDEMSCYHIQDEKTLLILSLHFAPTLQSAVHSPHFVSGLQSSVCILYKQVFTEAIQFNFGCSYSPNTHNLPHNTCVCELIRHFRSFPR